MDTTDLNVKATLLNEDEKKFKRDRARKRQKQAKPAPVPATGPCCLRCAGWRAPGEDDDFGVCRSLVVVSERVPMGPERGTVFGLEEASAQLDWQWTFLPTRESMSCSRFRERYEDDE